MFLKFLKFNTSLECKTEIFDGNFYRILIFRVKYFLNVCHSYYNSQNEYYKMQKTKDFFTTYNRIYLLNVLRIITLRVLSLCLSLKYISVRNQNVG